MINLKCKNIASAFEQSVDRVMKYGIDYKTEDGDICRELMNLNIEISDVTDNTISEKSMIKESGMKKYMKDLLFGYTEEQNFVYTYNERLRAYEINKNGLNQELDQIGLMIKQLNTKTNTRRAVAITWKPEIDNEAKDVPCLQSIICNIRRIDGKDKLFMSALFRSNDILLAMHSNMYGLMGVGDYIAEFTESEFHRYNHSAISAHVYLERDKDYLSKF